MFNIVQTAEKKALLQIYVVRLTYNTVSVCN